MPMCLCARERGIKNLSNELIIRVEESSASHELSLYFIGNFEGTRPPTVCLTV